MTSAYCWPLTFHRPGAWCPQRGFLVSVPEAMMMTAEGMSGCQRRISSQVSSRIFRSGLAAWKRGRLPLADPLPLPVLSRAR
jgi:hypothetical protein